MSHIVTIQTQIRDAKAVAAACRRLGLTSPSQGTARVFSTEHAGLIVKLQGWEYPIVCDLTTGNLKYDNYQGSWGSQSRLNEFLQAYAVEKAKIEAKRKGHRVTEQTLENGAIKLTVKIGGAS